MVFISKWFVFVLLAVVGLVSAVPSFSNVSHNGSRLLWNDWILFSGLWNDSAGLSGYVFGNNFSGVAANESFKFFGSGNYSFFNDSTSFKNLTFTGNGNQTVFFSIPKNSNITSAKVNLTGYTDNTFFSKMFLYDFACVNTSNLTYHVGTIDASDNIENPNSYTTVDVNNQAYAQIALVNNISHNYNLTYTGLFTYRTCTQFSIGWSIPFENIYNISWYWVGNTTLLKIGSGGEYIWSELRVRHSGVNELVNSWNANGTYLNNISYSINFSDKNIPHWLYGSNFNNTQFFVCIAHGSGGGAYSRNPIIETDYVKVVVLTNATAPQNVSFFVGLNNSAVFSQSGVFNTTNATTDFTSSLNQFLGVCSENASGFCNISLMVHSDSAGVVGLNNLSVVASNVSSFVNLSRQVNNVSWFFWDVYVNNSANLSNFSREVFEVRADDVNASVLSALSSYNVSQTVFLTVNVSNRSTGAAGVPVNISVFYPNSTAYRNWNLQVSNSSGLITVSYVSAASEANGTYLVYTNVSNSSLWNNDSFTSFSVNASFAFSNLPSTASLNVSNGSNTSTSVTLSNDGNQNLSVVCSTNASWVNCSSSSYVVNVGSQNSTLININSYNVSLGNYTVVVTFNQSSATNKTSVFDINLVTSVSPNLVFNTSSVSKTLLRTGTSVSHVLLNNTGLQASNDMVCSVSGNASASWISVAPSAAFNLSAGGSQVLNLSWVIPVDASVGTVYSTLSCSGTDSNVVNASLTTVVQAAVLISTPSSWSVTKTAGGTDTQYITKVENTGVIDASSVMCNATGLYSNWITLISPSSLGTIVAGGSYSSLVTVSLAVPSGTGALVATIPIVCSSSNYADNSTTNYIVSVQAAGGNAGGGTGGGGGSSTTVSSAGEFIGLVNVTPTYFFINNSAFGETVRLKLVLVNDDVASRFVEFKAVNDLVRLTEDSFALAAGEERDFYFFVKMPLQQGDFNTGLSMSVDGAFYGNINVDALPSRSDLFALFLGDLPAFLGLFDSFLTSSLIGIPFFVLGIVGLSGFLTREWFLLRGRKIGFLSKVVLVVLLFLFVFYGVQAMDFVKNFLMRV